MLMYQKIMFDRYYCLEKFIFHCMQKGADARITRRRFDNAAFRAYTNVSLTSQKNACYSSRFYDDVKFCEGPGILHAKSRIHVLTARELPC